MDEEINIWNVIKTKKRVHVDSLSRSQITSYLQNHNQKFCHECGYLYNRTDMFVQLYANNLYGYTCLECSVRAS
jgi:hypothetical protein